MAKASVTLTGCASFAGRGEFWKRRENRIISDPEWIWYFRSLPEFEVKLLDRRGLREPDPVETPEPVKAEPVKAEPVKAEPVKAEPVKAEPVEAEPVEAEPVEAEPVEAELNQEADPKPKKPKGYKQYTADQLRKETKASLACIARVQYKLKLNPEKPKELLVGQVLAAQKFAFEKANQEEA